MSTIERRYFTIEPDELRLLDTPSGKELSWFPAVFNSLSQDLGGFRETLKPSVFNRTLNNGADVRALFNHDPNFVIGRNTAGTLDLKTTHKGLRATASPPDTGWWNDLEVSIKRGDINAGSFAFRSVKDEWNWTPDEDGLVRREIQEAQLFDVSIVTYPAYPETSGSAGLRSFLSAAGIEPERLTLLIAKRRSGQPLDDDERSELQEIVSLFTPDPPEPGPSDEGEGQHSVTTDSDQEPRSRRLVLARLTVLRAQGAI